MSVRASTHVVLVGIVGLVACSSDTPNPTATNLAASGLTSCASVMHIGDSLTVGMMAEGQIPDPDDRLDGQYRAVGVTDVRGDGGVGRTIHEVTNNEDPGVQVATDARASGYGGCWVVELGTNDVALLASGGSDVGPRQRIDEMMAVIGSEPVLWLTAASNTDEGDYDSGNAEAWNVILRDAQEGYPNMQLYDWAAVVKPEWFAADAIHLTPEGFTEMARLIPQALAAAYPKS